MEKFSNLSITMCQINTVSGDLKGNFEKIKKKIKSNGYFLVFPETALTGYMVGSLWDYKKFLIEQDEYINEIIDLAHRELKVVIIGYARFMGLKENSFPKLKNSALLTYNGKVFNYDKQLLADSDHHEDKKYFEAGDETKVFEIDLSELKNRSIHSKIKIGIPICEELWHNDHERNIPREMKEKGADILISINQSYFYYGKQQKRIKLLSKLSKDLDLPILYLNSCGVGDILKNIVIFDGGSMAFNSDGRLICQMNQFDEAYMNVYPFDSKPINIKEKSKYQEITEALTFEQKEFFKLSGIEKAQVHLSGGIDSSVVGYLTYLAMGKDNTVFITNPSNLNSGSFDYINQFCEKLGTSYYENPIGSIVDELLAVDENSFVNSGTKLPPQGEATAHAVLRSVQGIMASHRFKSGIVSTGNQTEIVLGWVSFHDIGSIGVHALIGDLTKNEVYKLAKYLNSKYGYVIPEDLYNGIFKPSAELPDSDSDPFDYDYQSGICAEIIRKRKSLEDLLYEFDNRLLDDDTFPKLDKIYNRGKKRFEQEIITTLQHMRRSVYKASQSAPNVLVSPRSRGFSNRETLINKYGY